MILDRLIDKIGDWNPQIFRELKQRLTSKNIGLAAGISALSQGFVWFYFNNKLPILNPRSKEFSNRHYCLRSNINLTPDEYYRDPICRLDALGNPIINWQQWWSDVFTALSWMLPLGLILGTVYLLVADLVQEEKRGTLNFIRLSPQSAKKIFIGKILGVPILVYLAAALIIPFHLGAGIAAGASISLLSGWYLTVGAIWLLLSSAAVTYVLLGGVQAILTVVAVAYPVGLPLLVINNYAKITIDLNHNDSLVTSLKDYIRWFWLPISSTPIWIDAFIIGSCIVATYWVWQALERRYLNPTATAIGKWQSYQINLCLSIYLAGFAMWRTANPYNYGSIVWLLVACHFALLFLQIPALLPAKQVLQDWSRYRREGATSQHRKFWQQDLVFHEKSPALWAIAINLGIAVIIWVPILWRSFANSGYGMKSIAVLALASSLILIYAAIAHLSLFINFKQRNIVLVAILGATMCLPIAVAVIMNGGILGTARGTAGIILLFSPFAYTSIVTLSGTTVFAAFATQLAIFGVLTHSFQRKLQIIGRSQTKELLDPIRG